MNDPTFLVLMLLLLIALFHGIMFACYLQCRLRLLRAAHADLTHLLTRLVQALEQHGTEHAL